MLDEDPQLDSSVLGRTTGSDEPATEDGVDLSGGDSADAATDGGPDLPEGAEPDLKDIGAAAREQGRRLGRLAPSANPVAPVDRRGLVGYCQTWG